MSDWADILGAGARKTLGKTGFGALVLLALLVQFFRAVALNSPPRPCYYVAFSLVVMAGVGAIWAVFFAPRQGASN